MINISNILNSLIKVLIANKINFISLKYNILNIINNLKLLIFIIIILKFSNIYNNLVFSFPPLN